jgi:hypothetical protein
LPFGSLICPSGPDAVVVVVELVVVVIGVDVDVEVEVELEVVVVVVLLDVESVEVESVLVDVEFARTLSGLTIRCWRSSRARPAQPARAQPQTS